MRKVFLILLIGLSMASCSHSPERVKEKALPSAPVFSIPPLEAKFPLATSPFYIPEEQLPSAVQWPNYKSGRSGVYIASIASQDPSVFRLSLNPDNPVIFPQSHGTAVEIMGYLTFPTTSENSSEDYTVFRASPPLPKMLLPGEVPQFAANDQGFPLVIVSHGYGSDAFNRQALIRFIARQGYVVLALFHGDGRFANDGEKLALRLASLPAAVQKLQEDPAFAAYTKQIDFSRLGIVGVSFGGMTAYYAQKVAINRAEVPEDLPDYADFGAAVSLIPVVGDLPWSEGGYTSSVTTPLLFITGQYDEIAPQEMARLALEHTPVEKHMFSVLGAGHIVDTTLMGTLAVLHLDEHLKGDQEAGDILDQVTAVEGNRDIQRIVFP
jgi:dienelactone hydrolase